MDKIRIVSIKTIANNFIKQQIKILEKNKKTATDKKRDFIETRWNQGFDSTLARRQKWADLFRYQYQILREMKKNMWDRQ